MMERPSDLMRGANQAFSALYTEHAPPLTLCQLAVLRALTMHGPQTQTQLVQRAGIDRSSLAAMLPAMAASGLIAKKRDVHDSRANLVTIIGGGRAALAKAVSALNTAERRMLRLVPPRHRDSFVEGLMAISAMAR